MKKHFVILFVLGIVLAFVSCEEGEEMGEVIIYGTVISRYEGEPLYNVLVQETSYGAGSGVTGADGSYELTVPVEDNGISRRYRFVASKAGYGSSEYAIEVNYGYNGRRVKIDFQL